MTTAGAAETRVLGLNSARIGGKHSHAGAIGLHKLASDAAFSCDCCAVNKTSRKFDTPEVSLFCPAPKVVEDVLHWQ